MTERGNSSDSSRRPLVSIIIPTFNRFNCLVKCLENVRQQTYKNYEILAIDDCSSERYRKDLLGDIIFLQTPRNHGGPALARNVGLRACKGDYICFLDDDDAWHKDKLARQIKDLQQNQYFFSATEGRMILDPSRLDDNPEYHKQFFRHFLLENLQTTTLPRVFNYAFLRRHNYIINSSVMIDRRILENIGFLNESKEYLFTEDYEYWLRILSAGHDCLYLDAPLVYYNAFPAQRHSRA